MPVLEASNVVFTVTQRNVPRAMSEERKAIMNLKPNHILHISPPKEKKDNFKGWADSIKTFCRTLGNGTKTKEGNGFRYEVLRGMVQLVGTSEPEEGLQIKCFRTENAMIEAKKQARVTSNGQASTLM